MLIQYIPLNLYRVLDIQNVSYTFLLLIFRPERNSFYKTKSKRIEKYLIFWVLRFFINLRFYFRFEPRQI